jgi:hypothetical protein
MLTIMCKSAKIFMSFFLGRELRRHRITTDLLQYFIGLHRVISFLHGDFLFPGGNYGSGV